MPSQKKTAVSASLANRMADAAQREPPKDKITKVKETIAKLRDYEFENQSLQERIAANSEKIKEIKEDTLVSMFDEVGITNMGIEADGNLPPYDIEIKPYYHANVPEANQEKAFAWLEKNKHGDMIKGTYTVSFGRGEEKQRKSFQSYLEKSGFDYSYKFGVPWNTLTAFVREQIETYKREPPLKLLGATVGRVAALKKQKAEKKGRK